VRLLVKEAVSPLRGEFVMPNSKYHAHRAGSGHSRETFASLILAVRSKLQEDSIGDREG
jgi:hypothetical protein